MTTFFDKLFKRYPIETRRALEVFPGFFSWMLILLPIWGAFIFPTIVAYFILFFDVYLFYKSFSLVVTAYISSKRIEKSEKQNWVDKASLLKHYEKVNHIIIIPTYREPIDKLRLTLSAIASQTFPTKRLHVVLGMEKREEEAAKKAESLINEFKNHFGN